MRVVGLVLLMLATNADCQQVYKCQEGGRTVYSDVPCSGQGAVLSTRRAALTVPPSQPEHQVALPVAAPAAAGGEAHGTTSGEALPVCPNQRQLQALETSASSVTIGSMEQRFLQSELTKARACDSAGSPYTAQDWNRLQEAWDAQKRVDRKDRERERLTAQGIHDAAAARGGGIAAATEQTKRRPIAPASQVTPSGAADFLNCKSNGCSDSQGNWYFPKPDGSIVRSDGKWCQRIGNTVNCQ